MGSHVKGEKKVPVHGMKAYGDSRDTAPLIHNLGTKVETSDNSHTPNALPRYSLSRKLGGPQRRAERFAEEKKTLAPTGIPTELSRLLKEKKFIQNCSREI
jgi:hypothetical protein